MYVYKFNVGKTIYLHVFCVSLPKLQLQFLADLFLEHCHQDYFEDKKIQWIALQVKP